MLRGVSNPNSNDPDTQRDIFSSQNFLYRPFSLCERWHWVIFTGYEVERGILSSRRNCNGAEQCCRSIVYCFSWLFGNVSKFMLAIIAVSRKLILLIKQASTIFTMKVELIFFFFSFLVAGRSCSKWKWFGRRHCYAWSKQCIWWNCSPLQHSPTIYSSCEWVVQALTNRKASFQRYLTALFQR